MPMIVVLLTVLTVLATAPAQAEKRYQQVTVVEPFVELHTGPGRGFPIVNVVGRDGSVELLKRRTDWFKIRTARGEEGWVSREQIAETLTQAGEQMQIDDGGFHDLEGRRWEMGLMSGDFGGANVISVFAAFAFNRHLAAEARASQALGSFSNSSMASGHLTHTFFPEWRVTPFFTLGGGVVRTEPDATIVQTEDRTDDFAVAGVGLRSYLTRRFMFRAEYNSYVIFTSRDENEEIDEWKAGFSFFF